MSKNQTEILNLFRKNLFLKVTMRGMMHKLKKKSYQRIYEAIKELQEKNMIRITKAGHSHICEVKFSPETISTLAYLEEKEALSKKTPNIREILEFPEFLEDIILVTGSYAKGTKNKQSDIDLVIITKNNVFKKQKLIETLTVLFTTPVHPIVISHKDYKNMLLEKKENYGKEIFKNKLIYRNATRYFELLKEAIENGFIN